MDRKALLARHQLDLAQKRLAAQHVPQGAQRGAVGQQELAAPMAPQQNEALASMVQQLSAMGMIPPGAEAGVLAACGAACGGQVTTPFPAGLAGPNVPPWLQPAALMGIFLIPANFSPVTIQASCGNTFFYGCCARSFTPANNVLITAIISGANSMNRLCPDGAIDIAYFQTDECCCPFDFGCFSNLFPLEITYDPIDNVSSMPVPINMVIGGSRMSFWNDCWPYGPLPGQPSVPAM